MRIVISVFLTCLLLMACSKKEGYRYLGDTEPNQQIVPQDAPAGQE